MNDSPFPPVFDVPAHITVALFPHRYYRCECGAQVHGLPDMASATHDPIPLGQIGFQHGDRREAVLVMDSYGTPNEISRTIREWLDRVHKYQQRDNEQ